MTVQREEINPPKKRKAQWLNDMRSFISSSVSISGRGRIGHKGEKKDNVLTHGTST